MTVLCACVAYQIISHNRDAHGGRLEQKHQITKRQARLESPHPYSDSLILSPVVLQPSFASNAATERWHGIRVLSQFESAYAELVNSSEGSRLEELSGLLISKASLELSLDDFESFALGLKNTRSLSSAMLSLGERVANELDWSGKIQWMQDRSGDPVFQGAFGRIAMTVPPSEVSDLLRMAGRMENRLLSDAMLSGVYATQDVESIKKVINAYNNNELLSIRADFISSAPINLAASGRIDDALNVCSLIKDSAGRSAAYRAIIMNSVRESPSNAAAILARIEKESDRASVVDALVSGWSSSNLEEASKWVSNLAPGTVRDKAAEEVARSVMLVNPQDALSWANSIDEEFTRDNTVRKVMDHIKATNPGLWKEISN